MSRERQSLPRRREHYQQPRTYDGCQPVADPNAEWEQRCSEWGRRLEVLLVRGNWDAARSVIDEAQRQREVDT